LRKSSRTAVFAVFSQHNALQ